MALLCFRTGFSYNWFTGTARLVCRFSVCPSVLSGCRKPLLRVYSCGPGGQAISIDCCTAGGPAVSSSRAAARRSAANVVSGRGTLNITDVLQDKSQRCATWLRTCLQCWAAMKTRRRLISRRSRAVQYRD